MEVNWNQLGRRFLMLVPPTMSLRKEVYMAPITRPKPPVQALAQNDFLSATEDALTSLSVLTNDRGSFNDV